VAVEGALETGYSETVTVTGWVKLLEGMETVVPLLSPNEAGTAGFRTIETEAKGALGNVGVNVAAGVSVGVMVLVAVQVGVGVEVKVLVGESV